jgi:uncharacterized membrane protein
LEIQIPKLLHAGLAVSVALMAVGLAAAALVGAPSGSSLRVRDIPGALAALDPRGVLGLGILLLVLTPLVRVLASAAHFARERDRLYIGLTAVVLVNLALAVAVGAF